MPKSTKPPYGWVYAPAKAAPPSVPAAMKRTVEEQANALVANVLKPRHVQPPPENPNVTIWRILSPGGAAATSTSAQCTVLLALTRWAASLRASLRA